MTSLSPSERIETQTSAGTLVTAYFETINAADFEATAALFAANGMLYPPFGYTVTGREAIATYLAKEATGMRLCPNLDQLQLLPFNEQDGLQITKVTGKVHTSLFTVNVKWTFVLTPTCEIESVKVKLLASLEELLQLKAHPNVQPD